jgi:hypothetical protein
MSLERYGKSLLTDVSRQHWITLRATARASLEYPARPADLVESIGALQRHQPHREGPRMEDGWMRRGGRGASTPWPS